LTKNYNGLLIQTKQFSSENSKFSNLNNSNKETLSKNMSDFPRAEKIPNDNLRDSYNKIWNQFKEISKEKEQLMDSLKKETIRNEEQRNYIEILRQTIDSSLNKLGLNQLINNQKNNFPKHFQNTDIIVECTRYKSESEINKKENIILNIKINELKQEIEYLTKANQEMHIKKEKIRETLETGIKELEVAKERVKKLEQDKEYLIEDFENVKIEYEKAINDYNLLLTEYEKIKSENIELLEKKQELDKAMVTQSTLENKLIEHKTNFEKLNEDYKSILKERNNFETENTLNQEEIQSKNNQISELKEKIERQEELLKVDKDKLNDEIKCYHKQLNLLEKLNSDNLASISSKENIIKKLEDKVLYLENNSNTYKQLFEDVTNEFTQFKGKSEEESETLKNIQKELKELKENSDKLKEENTKLKETTEILEKENNKKKENLEEHDSKLKGLTESCENFIKNKSELEKQNVELKEFSEKVSEELDNLKKNYTEEINLKESEIEQIYSELAKFKNERDLYKSKLNEYTNDLEFLKNENINLEKESLYKVKLLQEENDRKDKNLRKSYEDCFTELDYYKKMTLEMKEEIDKLKQTLLNSEERIDSYRIQLDNIHAELEETYCRYEKVGKELQETIGTNQEIESKYNSVRRKYDEVIQRLEILEIENVRIEKNRRKLFEENENLKRHDKISPKTEIKNNFKDIKSAIHSCLNVAKNFINKIVSNKEYNDFSKIFTDKLPQYYHFSCIPANENNAIDSLRSLEDWIRIVCNELEVKSI
jgi:chromosome segregation ATPase